MTQSINNNLVCIAGKSASGKSASLRTLKNPEGVIYLNCEAGKELPFPNKFRRLTITNPLQVHAVFDKAEESKNVHTIIIDTMTYLMDMYESTIVLKADDGRAAWGAYAQFWKKVMQKNVAKSSKNVIILAHTMDILNEKEGVMETLIKVKGSLMNLGIESYFCNVIAAKKLPLSKLEAYKNPHLNVTPQEDIQGFKYVYQTLLTRETVHERIRGPIGLWQPEETFIDNDAQFVLDRLHDYYS